jgi:hypothetical protein
MVARFMQHQNDSTAQFDTDSGQGVSNSAPRTRNSGELSEYIPTYTDVTARAT